MLRGFFLVLLVVGSGAVFGRDLNKNGKMDPYEDSSRPVEERVENLLGQMTLDEKTCQLATLYGYGRVLKDKIFRPADPDKDFQEQGAEKKSFHGKGHWGQLIRIDKHGFQKVLFSLESSIMAAS